MTTKNSHRTTIICPQIQLFTHHLSSYISTFIHLSTHLFTQAPLSTIHLSIHLCICPFTIHPLSIIYSSVYPPSVHPSICPFLHPPIHPSIHPLIHPSTPVTMDRLQFEPCREIRPMRQSVGRLQGKGAEGSCHVTVEQPTVPACS